MATPAVGAKSSFSLKMKVLILRGWNRSSRGGSRSIFRCILWGVFAVAAGESGQTQEHGTCQKRRGNREFYFHSEPPCGHMGMTKRYVMPTTQRLAFLP